MKIGIDFDGVITKYPVVFSEMSRNPEYECYVITARPESHREYVGGYIRNYNISVAGILMIEEDLNQAHDQLYIQTVTKSKPLMCQRLGIDVVYDDDLRILNKIKEVMPNIVTMLVL